MKKNESFVENRIEINPKVVFGKPVIKGTRLSVEYILQLIASGWGYNEILEEYSNITQEDILACAEYAVKVLHEWQFVQLDEKVTSK